MRHVLVASADPELVDALREAADPSTTFLPETDADEALERLARSSRIDAVITDDPALVAAIRDEIPGAIPVHLRADGEPAAATLAALSALLGG
jgi:rRNA-processing protein FCF1